MSRLPIGWLTGDRRLADPNNAATVSALRHRLWLERAVFLVILALVAALLYRQFYPSGRWAIIVDGQPAAIVPSRTIAEQVLGYTLRNNAGSFAPQAKFRQAVGIEKASAVDGTVMNRWEAQRLLAGKVTTMIPVCWIVVDGQKLMALADKKSAQAALSEFARHYIPKGAKLVERPRFRQKVTLCIEPLPTDTAKELLLTQKEALAQLFEPSISPVQYTIRPGDTASRIAARYKVSLADLQLANKDVNLNRLRADETITVTGGLPPLSITYRVKEVKTREISFWQERIPDRTLAPGKKKQIQAGIPGKQAINSIVTYINDKEVSRTEQIGEILVAPTPERIAIGSVGKADDDGPSPQSTH